MNWKRWQKFYIFIQNEFFLKSVLMLKREIWQRGWVGVGTIRYIGHTPPPPPPPPPPLPPSQYLHDWGAYLERLRYLVYRHTVKCLPWVLAGIWHQTPAARLIWWTYRFTDPDYWKKWCTPRERMQCCYQGLSQDLETGCLKLAIVKFWGVQIFKGDHNILRFQPLTCMNLSK